MKCTEKEQESCNVEKRGCKGCFYNDDLKELKKKIEADAIDNFLYGKYLKNL